MDRAFACPLPRYALQFCAALVSEDHRWQECLRVVMPSRSCFAKGRIFCKCFKTGRTLANAAYRLSLLVRSSLSLVRAPPFAKHSVLHAGTAGRRASGRKEACFHPSFLLSPLS